MEGPQFSTKAESNLYRSWGFDVIGMTNLQEAKLAREAELCYATVAMVTDYDCWHPTHDSVTVDQIVAVLTKNAENACAVVREAVKAMPAQRGCKCGSALQNAILTDRTKIPMETRQKLALILDKYKAGGQVADGHSCRRFHRVRHHPDTTREKREGARGLGDAFFSCRKLLH